MREPHGRGSRPGRRPLHLQAPRRRTTLRHVHGRLLEHGRRQPGRMRGSAVELYILGWREHSRRKLSPTLATAYYSCPDNAVNVFPALGPWALPPPRAERGPSLESIYRVSLTVDLCEGQGRKLAAFFAPLSATVPAQHKNSPLPPVCFVLQRQLTIHTHPFNGSFPGTTRVSRYQKGKTNLDLLKQETVSGSGISWAICKSAPRSRQTTTPAPNHSVFYRPDALPAAQPTASKH